LVRQQAGDDVDAAARRGAGHDFHRPRRVGLAERGARPEQEQDRDRAHSGLQSVAGLEDPPYRSPAASDEQAGHRQPDSDVPVGRRNTSIQAGWAMRSGTNRPAVATMISPRITDLVAAAPTKPVTISRYETGADRIS